MEITSFTLWADSHVGLYIILTINAVRSVETR